LTSVVSGPIDTHNGYFQITDTNKVDVGKISSNSSEVQFSNTDSVNIRGGVETHSVDMQINNIKSTHIDGDADLNSSNLTTNSNVSIIGSMTLASSGLIMTNSKIDVKGKTKIANSTLLLNVDSITALNTPQVVLSSSGGIDGQFSEIAVDGKGLNQDCEKISATPSYETNVLSVIYSKDTSGCISPVVTDGAAGLSGVEIGMVVLFCILGAGVIAASVIFILFRKKHLKSQGKKIREKTARPELDEDQKNNSNLPGE
jgi:hypothetical protein